MNRGRDCPCAGPDDACRSVKDRRARNEIGQQIDNIGRQINVALENYPDIKAHKEIADVMRRTPTPRKRSPLPAKSITTPSSAGTN